MIQKLLIRTCLVWAFFFAANGLAMEIFFEGFNGFTAPPANFNGNQFESGLPVAHTGDLPDWTKSGAGTVPSLCFSYAERG